MFSVLRGRYCQTINLVCKTYITYLFLQVKDRLDAALSLRVGKFVVEAPGPGAEHHVHQVAEPVDALVQSAVLDAGDAVVRVVVVDEQAVQGVGLVVVGCTLCCTRAVNTEKNTKL